MTDRQKLYESSMFRGSYFSRMLHCGPTVNRQVEIALEYLPIDILDSIKESMAIVCTTNKDACRLARATCETREVIILSERIVPAGRTPEDDPRMRYFIHTILHEIAHAHLKHLSPAMDQLSFDRVHEQEKEADDLAISWFNRHVTARGNPHLKPITKEELAPIMAEYQEQMTKLYG